MEAQGYTILRQALDASAASRLDEVLSTLPEGNQRNLLFGFDFNPVR